MGEIRTLWKYPNRRLYDTSTSRYVRLEHVRDLMMAGSDVGVVERRGGQDITRHVLAQLAMELEENGGASQGLFSREFLTQVIYCQEKLGAENVSRYLDECLRLFFR